VTWQNRTTFYQAIHTFFSGGAKRGQPLSSRGAKRGQPLSSRGQNGAKRGAKRGQPLSSKYFIAFRSTTQYSAGHGSSLAY